MAMIILGSLFFGFSVFTYGPHIFLFLSILLLFGLSLGIFAIAIVLRFGPAAEWLAWPISFVLGPFVGVFYPISVLPYPLQLFSKILPPAYAFEGMRAAIHGTAVPMTPLMLGLVLGFGYVAVTFGCFVRKYKYVLRSGQITRFSAENA